MSCLSLESFDFRFSYDFQFTCQLFLNGSTHKAYTHARTIYHIPDPVFARPLFSIFCGFTMFQSLRSMCATFYLLPIWNWFFFFDKLIDQFHVLWKVHKFQFVCWENYPYRNGMGKKEKEREKMNKTNIIWANERKKKKERESTFSQFSYINKMKTL